MAYDEDDSYPVVGDLVKYRFSLLHSNTGVAILDDFALRKLYGIVVSYNQSNRLMSVLVRDELLYYPQHCLIRVENA